MSRVINKEALTDVGVYILEGMTEKESCVLSDVSYNELQHLKEKSEVARDFVEKKHIEFKHNHLKEMQKKKSEKSSQWLLEKLRPEEFGSKPKGDGAGPTINIISAIIKSIQNEDEGIIKISSRGNREQERNEESGDRLRVAEILG